MQRFVLLALLLLLEAGWGQQWFVTRTYSPTDTTCSTSPSTLSYDLSSQCYTAPFSSFGSTQRVDCSVSPAQKITCTNDLLRNCTSPPALGCTSFAYPASGCSNDGSGNQLFNGCTTVINNPLLYSYVQTIWLGDTTCSSQPVVVRIKTTGTCNFFDSTWWYIDCTNPNSIKQNECTDGTCTTCFPSMTLTSVGGPCIAVSGTTDSYTRVTCNMPPSVTPSVSPTRSFSSTTSPTPSVTPSTSNAISPSNSVTRTTTATPTPSASLSSTSSASISATISLSATVSASITGSTTNTASATGTNTATCTSTNTATATSTNTASATPTNTATATGTNTATATSTNTASATMTVSALFSPSSSQSFGTSPTVTASTSFSPSNSPSLSESNTRTGTQSLTPSVTASHTPSQSGSNTNTATASGTNTATGTPTNTATASGTNTATATPTNTATASSTNTGTASSTNTASASGSNTPTNIGSVSITPTASLSLGASASTTSSASASTTPNSVSPSPSLVVASLSTVSALEKETVYDYNAVAIGVGVTGAALLLLLLILLLCCLWRRCKKRKLDQGQGGYSSMSDDKAAKPVDYTKEETKETKDTWEDSASDERLNPAVNNGALDQKSPAFAPNRSNLFQNSGSSRVRMATRLMSDDPARSANNSLNVTFADQMEKDAGYDEQNYGAGGGYGGGGGGGYGGAGYGETGYPDKGYGEKGYADRDGEKGYGDKGYDDNVIDDNARGKGRG